VLLLNAGLIHRIGPNRIYVKMARLLASMGFVVLRFDFSGIGDSGPRKDKLPAAESMIDEMRQAMDYLEQFKNIKQFICIGLCDGATAAGQISVADCRVKKAVLIDPPVPENPQTELMAHSSYYSKQALLDPRSWLKFVSMQSSYYNVFRVIWMKIKMKLMLNHFQICENSEVITKLNSFFRSLRTRGVQLFIVYSGDFEGDIGDRYFREVVKKEYRMMEDDGLLTSETFRDADHLMTPIATQEKLLNLISNWLTK
jgi:alpha/beta superfamily hydrolase